MAYADPVHVAMAVAALEGWQRLEHDADTTLLTLTGGLDAGASDELDAIATQIAAAGIATERLTAEEATARFAGRGGPWFRFESDVLYQPRDLDRERRPVARRPAHARRAVGRRHPRRKRGDEPRPGRRWRRGRESPRREDPRRPVRDHGGRVGRRAVDRHGARRVRDGAADAGDPGTGRVLRVPRSAVTGRAVSDVHHP